MNEIILSVDRIENGFAILYDDDNNKKEILLCDFSFSIKEGDIIKLIDGIYIKDVNLTNERKFLNQKLLNSLWDTD